MCFKFLDVLVHLWSHPGIVKDDVTVHAVSTNHDCSKRSILSGLGDIFSAIFGDCSSSGYSKATINKIKNSLHLLQETQNLQDWQIKDELAFLNLMRVELGDQTKLLHTIELPLIQIQFTCADRFTYLETSRNSILSLACINKRLASIRTGITNIKMVIDKIYTYLEIVAIHTISPLLFPHLHSDKCWKI